MPPLRNPYAKRLGLGAVRIPEIGQPVEQPLDDLTSIANQFADIGGPPASYKRALFWPSIKAAAGAAVGVIGLPKRGIDYLARAGARAQGINVPDEMTTGQMLRTAGIPGLTPGFSPAQDADQGYATRLGGRAIEFVGDVGLDPVMYTGLGLPGMAGRVASGALAAHMGAGALEEGRHAYDLFQEQGLTPETAEEAFGTALSAGMAGLAARHALKRPPVAPVTALARRGALEPAAVLPPQHARARALIPEIGEPIEAEFRVLSPELEIGTPPPPTPGLGPGRRALPPAPPELSEPLPPETVDLYGVAARERAREAARQEQLSELDQLLEIGTLPSRRGGPTVDELAAAREAEAQAAADASQTRLDAIMPGIVDEVLGRRHRIIAPEERPGVPRETVNLDELIRQRMERLREEPPTTAETPATPPPSPRDPAAAARAVFQLERSGTEPTAALKRGLEGLEGGARSEAVERLVALRGGRAFVDSLRRKFGDDGPDGVETYPNPEGGLYFVQRHQGQIVGGGKGTAGSAREMVAGGRALDSPRPASEIYEAMDRAGVEPSTVLSPYGEGAQQRYAGRLARRDEAAGAAGDRPRGEGGVREVPRPAPAAGREQEAALAAEPTPRAEEVAGVRPAEAAPARPLPAPEPARPAPPREAAEALAGPAQPPVELAPRPRAVLPPAEPVAAPPVPAGHVRLYRGESTGPPPGKNLPEWITSQAGRWFSSDRAKAQRYAEQGRGRLLFVDVPEAEARAYNLGEMGNPQDEHMVSQAVRERARELGAQPVAEPPRAIAAPPAIPGEPGWVPERGASTYAPAEWRRLTDDAREAALRDDPEFQAYAEAVDEGRSPNKLPELNRGRMTWQELKQRFWSPEDGWGLEDRGRVAGAIDVTPQRPRVDEAAHEAATSPRNELAEPTEPQKEAGNYPKGHTRVAGLDISIENPVGSKRRPEWPVLKSHYGYIRGTVGKDKDHIDVFVKPGTPEDYGGPVFVVNQAKPDGSFDEHKVMLGYESKAAAIMGYKENYETPPPNRGVATFQDPVAFREWLASGNTKEPAGRFIVMKSAALIPTRAGIRAAPMGAPEYVEEIQPQRRPEPSPPAAAPAAAQAPKAEEGGRYGRLVVSFPKKPLRAVRTALRSAGFAWDSNKQEWSAPDTPAARGALEAARKRGGVTRGTAPPPAAPAPEKKPVTPQLEEVPGGGTSYALPAFVGKPHAEPSKPVADPERPKVGDRVTVDEGTGMLSRVSESGNDVKIALEPDGRLSNWIPISRVTAAEARAPESPLARSSNRAERLSNNVYALLERGEKFDNVRLTAMADHAFGGTRGEGKYTPRDAYDALEAGVNRYIREHPELLQDNPHEALQRLRELTELLPRQTDRTEEQVEFQQFSTPPTLAFIAAKATGIRPEDIVLEPSAGTGSLAVMAQAAGAQKVETNEIAPRRVEHLKALGFEPSSVDAEILNAVLSKDVKPTVVLMNPPFSATGGRVRAHKTDFGARHVSQALARLEPGGRLVAVVGGGMKFPTADVRAREGTGEAFREWWADVMAKHHVRANLGVSGEEYGKYGTTFDNQLLVIDKTGPTPGTTFIERLQSVAQGSKLSVDEALDRVLPIAASRPEAGRVGLAAPARPAGEASRPAGTGDRGAAGGGRRPRGPRAAGGAGTPPRQETEGRPAAAAQEQPAAPGPEAGVQPERGGAVEGPPPSPGEPDQLDVRVRGPVAPEPVGDSGTFVRYKPARIDVRGAKPHPANIVETASMGAVAPPPPTYLPALPHRVITSGALSAEQLESIIYSGQAHERRLPSGERAGFFIGDGTGVGKGREIVGVIYDNHLQARKKALWVSISSDLLEDAKRDLHDLGADIPIRILNEWGPNTAIDLPDGIVFANYATIIREGQGKAAKGEAEGETGQKRIDQLLKWLGDEPVMVFDEAHAAKNLVAEGPAKKGEAGSKRAQAVVDLQAKVPEGRVVYASATGATEPRNMAYMTRLGLWGPGTSFPNFEAFLAQINSAGLGAMEMVSRDMKSLGTYLSRQLSLEGVEFSEVKHELTPEQRQMYDTGAGLWHEVMQRVDEAVESTGGGALQKSRAISQFWAAQQRFFNILITSMKVPSAIKEADAALARGESVVLTLINTMEGKTTEKVAQAMSEGSDLESIDLSPTQQIAGYLERAFPTQMYQEVTNPDTGVTSLAPVLDEAGNPVHDPEAVAMKQAMLDKLSDIRMPDGPLDQLVNHYGTKGIAEISGRKRRLVTNAHGKKSWESRASEGVPAKRVNIAEMAAFNEGKKRVAVLSGAGAAGISLHSDKRFKNRQKRYLIPLQLPWGADTWKQFEGRTNRSNQAVPPKYGLLSSDVGGERRFSSTIASRLASMGALTRGQRDASSMGELAKYNFDSDYGRAATQATLGALQANEVADVPGFETLQLMGLLDAHGNVKSGDLTNINRFLNRILVVPLEHQNKVFDRFMKEFDNAIENAKEQGTFDEGVADLKATAIRVKEEPDLIHTDESTGAQTLHYTLEVDRPTTPVSWQKALRMADEAFEQGKEDERAVIWYRNKRSGRVGMAIAAGRITNKHGQVFDAVRLTNPRREKYERVERTDIQAGPYQEQSALPYEILKADEAEKLWREEHAKIPKHETTEEHLLSGVLLPIWERLQGVQGMAGAKVLRASTVDGRRIVGVQVPPRLVGQVLSAVGVQSGAKDPMDVFRAVRGGAPIDLVAGNKLVRRRIRGEDRIELERGPLTDLGELRRMGLINEQMEFKQRFFVPTDETAAAPILQKLLARYPVLEKGKPQTKKAPIAKEEEGLTLAEASKRARKRLQDRGASAAANDLGSAAAQGAGTLQDVAIIGAEFIARGLRKFGRWSRAMTSALGGVVKGLGQVLSKVWNQAHAYLRGRGATARKPVEEATPASGGAGAGAPPPPRGPRGVPSPEPPGPGPRRGVRIGLGSDQVRRLRDLGYSDRQVRRLRPEEADEILREGRLPHQGPPVTGRRVEPGESPRVEHKVEDLREVSPRVRLSRDAPRTWKSLDPKVRDLLDELLVSESAEQAFYNKARSGRLNDVETMALDALVAGKKEALETARGRLVEAQASGRETGPHNAAFIRAAFDQAIADLAKAARADVEAGTKLGRALAARARVMEAAGTSAPEQLLKRVFRDIPDITDEQAGDLVRVMQERPADLADALIALMKPGVFAKWMEAWKAGLVSAPGTQVANILGNVGEQEARVGESWIAGVLDPLLGGPRARYTGEAAAELRGQLEGARAGLGRLAQDLRDIATLRPERIDLNKPLELQVPAISGAKGRFVRIPFRLLNAFDNFFKAIGGQAELRKLAFRRAGGDRAEATRIADELPIDLLREVEAAKKARTFQDPNKFASLITRARSELPWLHIVAPFIQTPANIARASWRRSPGGFYRGYKALRTYRRAASRGAEPATAARLKGEALDALAQPILGTMVLGAFAALAKAGGMTGSGPTDQREKNALRDTGWQPYSFVVELDGKKHYIPFNRFEPVSTLLGLSADMVEAKDQKTAGDLFDKALGSIGEGFLSKTYLTGLADAVEVINDPKRFAGQWVSSFAASQVPNIIRKTAQAIDPTLRETKGDTTDLAGTGQRIVRSVQAGIPGLSSRLPARTTATGEPVERPGGRGVAGALARFGLPSVPSAEKEGSELQQLMVKIGAVPGAPGRDVTINGRKVRLGDDEYEELHAADRRAAEILRGYLGRSNFLRLADTVAEGGDRSKEAVIEKVYREQRSRARQRIYRSTRFRARARVEREQARSLMAAS